MLRNRLCMKVGFVLFVPPPPGYGHTAPLSDGGKAFCILYSVIGIPFTLLFLTAVVQRIMVFSTRRPVMYIHRRWGLSKPVVAIVHAAVLAALAVSCFFLIPAAIFSALEENWNFLESFYFCFISLSTIGLGDYVPGEATNQKFRELYKVGITGESLPFFRGKVGAQTGSFILIKAVCNDGMWNILNQISFKSDVCSEQINIYIYIYITDQRHTAVTLLVSVCQDLSLAQMLPVEKWV